jgi:hypothetical protein
VDAVPSAQYDYAKKKKKRKKKKKTRLLDMVDGRVAYADSK